VKLQHSAATSPISTRIATCTSTSLDIDHMVDMRNVAPGVRGVAACTGGNIDPANGVLRGIAFGHPSDDPAGHTRRWESYIVSAGARFPRGRRGEP